MSSSSSSKSKPSSGLRILWIPGRKKHNRKGVYNPTKHQIPQYQANQQRKTELWSLGGSVNQAKIINAAGLHDNLNVGMATAATSTAMSLASMAANKTGDANKSSNEPAGATAGSATACSSDGTVEFVPLNDLNGDITKKEIPTSNQFEALELIDEEKDRNYSNAQSSSSLLSSNNDSRSGDYVHNSATLAIGEAARRRRRNSYNNSKKNSSENLDSIDHMNDSDTIDAIKMTLPTEEPRLDTFRQSKKKNKKKNRPESKGQLPDDEDESDKGKNEKLVTCLYYSLVCWDCSIS